MAFLPAGKVLRRDGDCETGGISGGMRKQHLQHLLIQTKLIRPKVSGNWVHRPRLGARLEEALKKRVTLISAPPGFGKATLAAQWLDKIPGNSAWLSLDKDDSDPEGFLREGGGPRCLLDFPSADPVQAYVWRKKIARLSLEL